MKREKYFRDELQHLFFLYAAVPVILFTLIGGLVFMAVLLQGRREAGREHSRYGAETLDRLLEGYTRFLDQIELPEGVLGKEEIPEIFTGFYRISNELGYEAELYLLDKEGRLLVNTGEGLPSYLKKEPGISWGIFRAMEEADRKSIVRLEQGWNSKESCLAAGRCIGGDEGGYVLIGLRGDSLQDMLQFQDAQMLISDAFGWVLFSNNPGFLTVGNQIRPQLRSARGWLLEDRHLYLISEQDAREGGFRIYSISDLYPEAMSLTMGSGLVLMALAVMTLWVFFSSRKVTEKKTEDFYRILDVLKHTREGNLDAAIQIERDNEFKIIADSYNETIASLKDQMEHNQKMAELLVMAQTRQLESQFNPHFLFNTLENIRYMCKLEPATAERMVFSLSNLLRYSLDQGRGEVTVEEDLEHLKNYLTILERRFGSRFTCSIHVEDEVLGCMIPRLVIQPMIENAVKYGFGSQPSLKVELKAYIHEENLMMICRDDGVGISPALLKELTELLEQKENTSRHSGLYNIHRRIRLLYGQPYGVEIRSAEGHGTTVVTVMPVRK